ncbi:hypothetical protein RRG08_036991 [Elysia crispata]|uniref:Uncharacterized protein n=1 Tax=Elysia crispata TaxID=231223 RepID=A0AAE1CLV4_9GAST|nr:hypothetical protein RRG08_036991 [Elysia crispata]
MQFQDLCDIVTTMNKPRQTASRHRHCTTTTALQQQTPAMHPDETHRLSDAGDAAWLTYRLLHTVHFGARAPTSRCQTKWMCRLTCYVRFGEMRGQGRHERGDTDVQHVT